MRLRYLLLTATLALTISNPVLAQINKVQYLSYGDSLNGFDETAHRTEALQEGLSGNALHDYLEGQRRAFITLKYDLGEPVEYPGSTAFPSTPLPFSTGKVKGGPGTTFNAPCVNEGFESGSFGSSWVIERGRNTSSQVYPTFSANISSSPGTQAVVLGTPVSDAFVGTIPASPLGGSMVARINNTTTGTAAAVRISQSFPVTLSNYLYDFAYWAVMENAGNHSCTQTPYMSVRIRNFTGVLQSCPNFSIVAPSTGSSGCAGIGPLTWTTVTAQGRVIRTSNGWQKFSIDLTAYIGQNVTVEVIVSHCSLTGHFGYAYFDSNCNTMNLTVNNTTTLSMPTPTVYAQGICGNTATLTAPSGLNPYQWFGPPGSGISGTTATTIVTPMSGNYTLNMSPTGICNSPMQRIINLTFPPPTTLTASPATVCESGSPSSSTLSISGASSYTWETGSNASSIVVSPTATTIYSVSVQTGTCIGTRTIQVNVAPNPVLTVSNPNPNICSGGSSTLSAGGANSYTWMPGNLTGSTVVVSPVTPGNHVYTVTGVNVSGCADTETTIVSVGTASSISIFNLTGSVCAGNPVMLVATGYATFTWTPSNPLVTGNPGVVTPTANTIYTAIGGVGSCTNTATISVIADQGPSMTISASPTITCPGINATLSAVAPSAVGSLSWNPGALTGTSIVVNPITTTIYSVTGRNSNNCPRTYTINKLVAPNPTLVFAPSNPTVCNGSAITLTASGGTSYTWNPGGVTTNTRLVTPSVNTTYSVSASNGSCTTNSTIMVSVIPTPTVNASASPTAICRGNFSFLSASGANSYVWQPGNMSGANALVNPTVNTTYTVTGTTAGCSSSRTVMIVVNPLPTITAVANPTAICPGFCSTLSASGASTYTFSGGTVVCPTSNTTYSVTGTSTAGCNSASPGTVLVTVNPTPNVVFSPASPTLCAGSSVNVSASGAAGYTWMPGNTTGPSANLSPTVNTVYTVTAVNAQGCISQRTLAVTVIQNPTITASASPSAICRGNFSFLSASGGASYLWQPGNISGANALVNPTVTTTYTVTGTSAGCSNSRTVTVVVNPRPIVTVNASPATLCAGQCSTLTPSGASNYTYLPAGPVVCPSVTTTYSITGTNAFGCPNSPAATVNIIVNPLPVFNLTASSNSICAGSSATITASGATAYTWNPGNLSGTSVIVSPTVTTTYTVTGASASGCSDTRTITITVLPSPVVNASASPATICSGSSSTLSASGANTYVWMPGNLAGANPVVSPAGTTVYTVTGSTSGCSTTRTVLVTVNPSPTITASANPSSICAGASSTLSASGAASYVWNPGGQTGSQIVVTPGSGTQYTVTGTAAGCTGSALVNVVVNPNPTVTVVASTSTVCSGGPVTYTASGATNYNWLPGNVSGQVVTFNPTVNTTYTVTGTTGAGCTNQRTVAVVVIPNGTIVASVNPLSICAGQSATLTASGATTYTWAPISQTGAVQVVSPTVTTVYSVFGNNAGCPASSAQVTLTVNPLPVISLSSPSSSICSGNSTTLSASGALSYIWMPGSLSGANVNVNPSVTTTYTVTGTGAGGCTSQATIAIQVVPTPTISANATPSVVCAGSTVNLNASGATSFVWNPGNLSGASVNVAPSSSTNYTVTGTSAGCSSTRTVQVNVNSLPVISASTNSTNLCLGQCATVSATGGTSYTWNPGSLTGASLQVCPSSNTTYTVTGRNAAGCTSTHTVQINVNNPPSLVMNPVTTTICAGQGDSLEVSGGISYTWMPGGSNNGMIFVTPTVTTVYTVTGVNASGCSAIATATIFVNPAPVVNVATSPATVCAGGCSTLTASGASSYNWSTGSSGAVVVVCPSVTTTYSVIGFSSAGCPSTITPVTVTANSLPVINAFASPNAICPGSSATLSAAGATGYTWMPGNMVGQAQVVTPSVSTTYTVTGSNAAGCLASGTVAVIVNPQPVVNIIASSNSVCAGLPVVLSGTGTATSYSWLPGGMTGPVVSVTPVVTTTYTLTGTNAFGCSRQATTTIVVVPLPVVNASSSPTAVCIGNCATLTASGATSYTWLPGLSSGNTAVVCPTTTSGYTVVGQSGSCFNFTTLAVQVNPLPTVLANASPTAICPGGSASLSASGAASYTWNPGNLSGQSVPVTPLASTNYTVNATSSLGCVGSATTSVTVFTTPVISISASSNTVCAGGSVTLNPSGASSYTWSPGGPTIAAIVVTPSVTTTYTVTGLSPNGCPGTQTITINVIPIPPVLASASPSAICNGSCTTLSASGATSYTWSTGNSGTSVTVCPTTNTVYMVTGSANGCSGSSTVAVTVNNGPALTVAASPTAVCPGGSSTLTASGGASYIWSPGGSTGSQLVVIPTSTSVYTVQGFSSFGCSTTATVGVQLNPNPVLSAAGSATSVCTGQSAQLIANGANSYTWMPGSLTGSQVSVSPSSTTVYTVTGATAGCTASISHTLTVNPLPVIAALASPASICNGSSSTLTATGALGYTWSPGGMNGSTVVVSPTVNTAYIVTGTNSFGCAGTQTVSIAVNPTPAISLAASSTTICSGNSATLTASGTLSYSWMPISQTGSAVVVNPGTTTTYTVIGSNSFGCSDTQTITIVVNPTPTVTVNASATSVCQGFTTSLSAAGASNYTWQPGNMVSNPVTVTVSATTVYSVLAETNGCVSTGTILINAVPLPTIIASAVQTLICAGETATLNATGATSYTWLPILISGSTVTDTPLSTTQYTVVGIGSNGCPNFATADVTVLPVPSVNAVASSPSVCLGSTGTLSATGAVNYTWQPGNLTGQSVTISPTSQTTYTVTGDNGACTNTAMVSVGIHTLPVISAAVSPTVVCEGLPVNLTASGGLNYTWSPISVSGASVTDNPTVSLTYTVTGDDANGCENTALVSVSVNPNPTILAVANPTGMCEGSLVTVSLSVSGANSFTWFPSGLNTTTITDSPTVTTTYSVSGTDALGCIGNGTVQVGVFPIPTLAISPLNTSVCAGNTVTLTATGATNYTWLPGGSNASVEIVSPGASTTYTLIGDNGGICMDTATVNVFINPLPANVTAGVTGTITCATPSVDLLGSSTDTNVSYSWSGPAGYTATIQNPTGITVWGIYTLTVTDNLTGCAASVTVDVPTDNSIPSVTASTTGSITCATTTVTLNAINSTTNAGYSWSGPSGFTGTTQAVNITAPGEYTVVVTDLTSNCTGSAVVTVGSHTEVAVTASITAATCSAGVTNNDGTIMAGNFGPADKFDLVSGPSYTGSLTYTSAINIPGTGIITNNLANPSDTVRYTLRIFDSLGCVKDFVLTLDPVDCVLRPLGIAKSASTPTLNSDGTYDVTYTIIVKNYDSLALDSVILTENLSSTFPSPATFSLSGTPQLGGSTGLVLNTGFDGVTQTALTGTASNLVAGDSAAIIFTVRVTPNGFFGPFSNSVMATARNNIGVVVNDLSTEGDDPDPDGDNNPRNNSESTVINLTPQLFFGLTKEGTYKKLDNNSYDVSYTVTVHNLGNDTLTNVVLLDSLFNNTIKAPASYSVKGAPAAQGMLVANTEFDGRFDIHLLNSAQSKIAPGQTSSVSFTINVIPDTVTVVVNSAYGSAISSFSGTLVEDISNDGDDPDSNNNGVWNEATDNVPTVLSLPLITAPATPTLFIPEGFSPDGDGINDAFVIKGLPETGENKLTVFNRWGNRVYLHGNYDNSWRGYPNIGGTFGNDRLPPGTYYYILEIKGSDQKAITGFVVLQY